MIFSGLEDSHDRRVQKILEAGHFDTSERTNFNLVGIRRRLNNIEAGVWIIVALIATHVWRHW
jgi:ABC-type thiamin/hydroxymethylpyrimidine transport system permease subunit